LVSLLLELQVAIEPSSQRLPCPLLQKLQIAGNQVFAEAAIPAAAGTAATTEIAAANYHHRH